MANAYSVLHNYDTPVFTPNYQLIATAMQYKQGKIDANRQRLQTMYDALAIVDVAKDQDKEYVERRLQSAKTIANKYASLDLSSNNLTNQLIGKLSDVVDDNVKNAVLSTRIYRSEQAAWDKLREEKPDKYNEANHAYAMQGANSWLNDGKTGSKYNGGGEVIEFVDLSKKIMDNLPTLQKALKAEWIQQGPQQGYFRSMDTYEAIPREKMEEALGLLFNSKDKQQMGINAWEKYDKMDEAQLKESYDNYFSPRVDYINERLNSVDMAISNASTEAEKEELRKMKSQLVKVGETYQNNSYENVASTYGKEAAYNRLYQEQYYNGILDTYSYGPRLIERKVDEMDKANKEYQLKLNADRRAEEKAQFDRDMGIAKLEFEREKHKLENPGLYEPIIEGEDIVVETPKARGDEIELMYEQRDASIKGMEDILKGAGLTPADLASADLVSSIGKIASNGYIEVSGKKIPVTDDNRDAIMDYYNNVVKENPATQAAMNKIGGLLDDLEGDVMAMTFLGNGNGQGVDWSTTTSMPNFNFYIKDGKIVKTDAKTHIAKDFLLRKADSDYQKGGGLSADEQKSLKLYMGLWLLNDPSIGKAEQRLTRDYVNKILSTLPKEEAAKISTDIKNYNGVNMPNTHGAVNRVYDYWLSEIDAGDMEFTDASTRYKTNIQAANSSAYRLDKSKAIYKKVQGNLSAINTMIAKNLSETQKMPFLKQQIVAQGSSQHTTLRRIMQVPEDMKSDIYIEKQFDAQGLPTNKNKVYYRVKNSSDAIKAGGAQYIDSEVFTITDEKLKDNNVVVFDTKRHQYDATHGDLARKLPLGNNVYSDVVKDSRKLSVANGLPEWYSYDYVPSGDDGAMVGSGEWGKNYVQQTREDLGDDAANMVRSNIETFRNGNFNFSMESRNGVYQVIMKDWTGNEMHTFMPVDANNKPLTTLDEYVNQLISDPRAVNQETFRDYLNKLRENISVGAVKPVTSVNNLYPSIDNLVPNFRPGLGNQSYMPGY